MNRRSLERLFRLEVGISPKLYARIGRVQGVLGELDGGRPVTSWSDVAIAHGFSDQSHMIRDFRAIVGTTPERFLSEQTAMAHHFCAGDLSHSSNR